MDEKDGGPAAEQQSCASAVPDEPEAAEQRRRDVVYAAQKVESKPKLRRFT